MKKTLAAIILLSCGILYGVCPCTVKPRPQTQDAKCGCNSKPKPQVKPQIIAKCACNANKPKPQNKPEAQPVRNVTK